MKEYLRALVRTRATAIIARSLVREYLQARILEALQRAGAMTTLAFYGGTALRFLYAIPRYSEDLDFALEQQRERYDFRAYLQLIRNDLTAEGYQIEVRVNDQKVVNSALIRFLGLLYELGISPHPSEVLAVKLEVDTNPPVGAGLTTTIVRRHVTLHLHHHDQASLLAGKLHAILQRSYTKGRDLYDLFWYLSDPHWPTPNLIWLNYALQQTGWTGDQLTEHNWRTIVQAKLETLNWESTVADVRPFLEKEHEVQLLTRDHLSRLLLRS